ncbi:hypothetical protein BpHYR1_032645 [Brachionus plicatilis]|uniref:Uncharacterized protein n=1 Tax=Brachionus plicatilis TaxID=10195 RepID=A0A3M7Q2E4_BRAPC|nr:hypothetical protein BpHYR1_032645 [Brachionus plicatilis]
MYQLLQFTEHMCPIRTETVVSDDEMQMVLDMSSFKFLNIANEKICHAKLKILSSKKYDSSYTNISID